MSENISKFIGYVKNLIKNLQRIYPPQQLKIYSQTYPQEYLDVCFRFNNCGECAKCYRTLVTLDVLGKVDGFRKIFDVDKFLEKRDFAYAWLLKAKDGDKMDDNAVFATEIYNYALDHGFKIPDRAYLIYKKRKRSSTPWGRLKTKIKKSIINEKNY